MPEISEELLHDVASNVARRIASGNVPASARSGRSVFVALSSDGAALDIELTQLSLSGESLLAVVDSTDRSTPALASAMARLPRLVAVQEMAVHELDAQSSTADRVVVPAMSLALASRVASLQSDTPAARVILRAALHGVPVTATLNEDDFALSDQAPSGARRAVEGVLERLRDLGIHVGSPRPVAMARTAAAGATSSTLHPSVDRFAGREPLRDFVDSLASKPCSIEPGQPCVDCGVCEMRGF